MIINNIDYISINESETGLETIVQTLQIH